MQAGVPQQYIAGLEAWHVPATHARPGEQSHAVVQLAPTPGPSMPSGPSLTGGGGSRSSTATAWSKAGGASPSPQAQTIKRAESRARATIRSAYNERYGICIPPETLISWPVT